MNGIISAAAVIVISFFAAVAENIFCHGKYYTILYTAVAVLSLIPLLVSHGNRQAVKIEVRIVFFLTFLSALNIEVCSSFSFFRPFTALTAAAGIYFGAPAGFTCGIFSFFLRDALSGFGGKPVLEALTLGTVGFLSGITSSYARKGFVFPTVSAVIYSAVYSAVRILCEVYTEDNSASVAGLFTASAKWLFLYGISDAVLLLLIMKFLGRKTERMKKRFRIFEK